MQTSNVTGLDVHPELVLLDLNYTLVGNSPSTMWARRYEAELYRGWLVDLLRGTHVALVTVRPIAEREATLARIAKQTGGWQPTETHFNDAGVNAATWKEEVLRKRILPRFGAPGRYLAIESNAAVHRVYDAAGVPWCKVESEDRWTEMPKWWARGSRASKMEQVELIR
jgi:hypothetical protein